MADKQSIIQFNCNGFRAQFNEIKNLIFKYDPDFILLQELKVNKDFKIKMKGYNVETKIDSDSPHQPSVAILIKIGINYKRITLSQHILAVGIETTIDHNVAIFSYYDNTRLKQLSEDNLNLIINSTSYSCLIMGDFNSRHRMWDLSKKDDYAYDQRSNEIIEFLNNNNFSILNDGSPTRISSIDGHSNSAIDLTIIHSSLSTKFEWNVANRMYGSDHLPTMLANTDKTLNHQNSSTWNFNSTNWNKFNQICDLNIDFLSLSTSDEIDEFFQKKIEFALEVSTNKIKNNSLCLKKKYSPWWNDNLHCLKNLKRKSLRNYINKPTKSNLIELKKNNAKFKLLLNQSKLLSWENYITKLNGPIETKDLWKRLKKINNIDKPTRIRNIVDENNVNTDDQEKIANIIGKHYQSISSETSLSPEQVLKRQDLVNDLLIQHNNKFSELDNEFTFVELLNAIKNTKNSSAGPDQFKYIIYKKMEHKHLRNILNFYNHIWKTGNRPKSWNMANVIPIPKQKCVSSPTQTRPINLINTIVKLFDKMVNSRLIYVLELNKMLDSKQFGFRQNKTTLNSMVTLNRDVQNSFNNKSHIQLVSFDIEKAFDKIWPEAILCKLKKYNIGGNMFLYIKNFLNQRKFIVKNGMYSSDEYSTNIGIPQGSPLSSTLFLISFQNILDEINKLKNVNYSSYADDLIVYCNNNDNNTNTKNIQDTIDKIVHTGSKYGLNLSKDKTKAIHFCNKRKCKRKDNFIGDNKIIEFDSIKILGIVFQKKLNWRNHINHLKAKITKDIPLIKILSNTKYGLNQDLLREIIRSLVISKINYGIELFGNSTENHLLILDRQLNHIKRLLLQAFITTPTESLSIESDILSMNNLINLQNLNTMARFKHTSDFKYDNNSNHKSHSFISETQLKKMKFQHVQMHKKETLVPPWNKVNQFIFSNIYKKRKEFITKEIAFQTISDFTSMNNYRNIIYTDGSKFDDNAGYAGVMNHQTIFAVKVHSQNSIFMIEAQAILHAINYFKDNNLNQQKNLIISDSLSVLEAIQNTQRSKIEIINKIKMRLDENINILWCPGHLDITGNELADSAAKNIARSDESFLNILYYQDYKYVLKKQFKEILQREWNLNISNKLQNSKKQIGYQHMGSELSKKDIMVLNRIKLGHSYLTHSHLISKEQIEKCKWCNEPISIFHIFNCDHAENISLKRKHKINNYHEEINEIDKLKSIIAYIKELDYYHLI